MATHSHSKKTSPNQRRTSAKDLSTSGRKPFSLREKLPTGASREHLSIAKDNVLGGSPSFGASCHPWPPQRRIRCGWENETQLRFDVNQGARRILTKRARISRSAPIFSSDPLMHGLRDQRLIGHLQPQSSSSITFASAAPPTSEVPISKAGETPPKNATGILQLGSIL